MARLTCDMQHVVVEIAQQEEVSCCEAIDV